MLAILLVVVLVSLPVAVLAGIVWTRTVSNTVTITSPPAPPVIPPNNNCDVLDADSNSISALVWGDLVRGGSIAKTIKVKNTGDQVASVTIVQLGDLPVGVVLTGIPGAAIPLAVGATSDAIVLTLSASSEAVLGAGSWGIVFTNTTP